MWKSKFYGKWLPLTLVVIFLHISLTHILKSSVTVQTHGNMESVLLYNIKKPFVVIGDFIYASVSTVDNK